MARLLSNSRLPGVYSQKPCCSVIAIGMIVSGVFGVLPVLTAVKIRPGIILRPNETHLPRAGVLQSLLALLLVVVALGLIAGQILNNIAIGLIGTAATLLILGILIGLLWIVVWVVGRIPAFGNVNLKLALRNLRSKRVRTATTLLALSAGMFALSSIAFFGAGMRQILQTTLTGTLGGNVMIFPVLPAAIANPLVDNRLDLARRGGVAYPYPDLHRPCDRCKRRGSRL